MKGFIILSLLLVIAYCGINHKYKEAINSKIELTEELIQEIFEQYQLEYPEAIKIFTLHTNSGIEQRKQAFADNLRKIVYHNSNPYKTYTMGINFYSCATYEEIKVYFNLKPNADQDCSATSKDSQQTNEEVPDYWDWRLHNGVTPVKDQGNCGSCWSFSTVGAMEAHYLIKFKEFRYFSEQQLIDCAQAFDNNGCDGGLPSHAFEYIYYNQGLTTEDQYPYGRVTGDTCKYYKQMASVGTSQEPFNITVLDEEQMKVKLYENGPVSVTFDCEDDFLSYVSGIYASNTCGNHPLEVNHAVLAVGFGTDQDSGLDYWIVKNSWGTSWGDQGYFKIQRGVNMCGIGECNSYPQGLFDATTTVSFLT